MMAKNKNEKMFEDLSTQYLKLMGIYAAQFKREDIDYDASFETISKKNISNRDESYTSLLAHFVKITRIRNIVKEIHKWLYFWIITVFMAIFLYAVCHLIINIDLADVTLVSGLSVILPLLMSFTSVVISIPLIVTKYLFSSKEDKRIAKLIEHTQNHDLDGKKILESVSAYQDIKHIDHEVDKNDEEDELIDKVIREVRNNETSDAV